MTSPQEATPDQDRSPTDSGGAAPKGGSVSDAKVFALAEGLTWKDTSDRTWTVSQDDLRDWIGNRAEAGRLPPKGFPKTNRFG